MTASATTGTTTGRATTGTTTGRATTGPAATGAAAGGAAAGPASPGRPPAAPRRAVVGSLAVTAWALALLALACVPLVAAFTSLVVLALLAAALVLPFTVVAVARRLAVPAWATAAAGVMLVLGVATSFARVGQVEVPVDDSAWRTTGAAQVLGPLVDSVARLLTAPRPAPPSLSTPVVALVALVALAVALALGRRGRSRVAPLVGAVVVYGVALLLTAGQADDGSVGASLVALAGAGWCLLDGEALDRRRVAPRLGDAPAAPRARWRSGGLAALGVVVLVAALGATAAGAVTGRAFEPRDHVTPPRVPAAAVHPLAELSRWQSEPDAVLLRVHGTHPGHLTWVTLPDHDGSGWFAELDLRALGAVVEPSLPPGQDRADVDVEVELVEIAGPSGSPGTWLPSTGTVRATSAPDVLADVDAGVLAVPPAPDGRLPAGLTYRVRGEVDRPDRAAAAAAAVPGGHEVDRYLALERFPADLRAYAQDVVAGATSRLDQAERLAETVRGDRELATDAVSGTSYARLREFLFADRQAGGQVGSSEQFAGAFAVLARAVGLPSRVVLGFEVPGGAAVGDATPRDVRGEDMRAWAEVYLAGSGWVRFDPAPDAVTTSALHEVAPPPQGTDTAPEEDPVVDEPQEPADEETADDGGGGGGADRDVVALALGAVLVGALVVGALATLGARALRRVRLRAAGAVGAWQHVTDALLLRDGPPAPGATADDLAARVTELSGVAVGELAAAAQAAAFGAVPVPRASTWRTAVAAERGLRAGAPRGRRVTWWADRAPLRGRRPVDVRAPRG